MKTLKALNAPRQQENKILSTTSAGKPSLITLKNQQRQGKLAYDNNLNKPLPTSILAESKKRESSLDHGEFELDVDNKSGSSALERFVPNMQSYESKQEVYSHKSKSSMRNGLFNNANKGVVQQKGVDLSKSVQSRLSRQSNQSKHLISLKPTQVNIFKSEIDDDYNFNGSMISNVKLPANVKSRMEI